MWKQIGKLAMVLCAVVWMGMSTHVVSAERLVEIGEYNFDKATHTIYMDLDSIVTSSDGGYTYYHVDGKRRIRYTQNHEEQWKILCNFRYNPQTGEWLGDCDGTGIPYNADYNDSYFADTSAYDNPGQNMWDVYSGPFGPSSFVTNVDLTPGYFSRKYGAATIDREIGSAELLYRWAESTYFLRALIAHQKGQAITIVHEGTLR